VVDIGCGSGRISLLLQKVGVNVIGFDINPVALASFQRRSTAVPLLMGDAEHLPFRDGKVDCLVAIQSLLYFGHCRFLQECNRVLRKGGLLIFQFLNLRSYKWALKKLRGRKLDGAVITYCDSREMLRTTAAHGFDIEAVSGYNWVPFERFSNSALVDTAAMVEKKLRLERYYSISPWVLVAARKLNS